MKVKEGAKVTGVRKPLRIVAKRCCQRHFPPVCLLLVEAKFHKKSLPAFKMKIMVVFSLNFGQLPKTTGFS